MYKGINTLRPQDKHPISSLVRSNFYPLIVLLLIPLHHPIPSANQLPQPPQPHRIMPPRLRLMRRTLPVRTAGTTRDRGTARQVGAAVATVEDEGYAGRRC